MWPSANNFFLSFLQDIIENRLRLKFQLIKHEFSTQLFSQETIRAFWIKDHAKFWDIMVTLFMDEKKAIVTTTDAMRANILALPMALTGTDFSEWELYYGSIRDCFEDYGFSDRQKIADG